MHKKPKAGVLLSFILLIICAFLSLGLGSVRITFREIIRTIFHNSDTTTYRIILYSRIPRTFACLLAGSALSVSGCLFQTVLGNRLASPGIIGVNAGAGLAVCLCSVFGIMSGWSIAFFSFFGALCATVFVMLIAYKTGASRTTIVLSGVALNAVLNGLRDALAALFPTAAIISSEFRVGGFSSVIPGRLLPASVIILITLLLIFYSANELDVLSLGEDTAKGLGMNVDLTRNLFLISGSLLAGTAVAFSGIISFVGLLIPHISRRFIGTESRYLLPFCAFSGSAFITACDILSRVLFVPYELPVGIIMSVLGGPFFLYLLIKNRGGHSHA